MTDVTGGTELGVPILEDTKPLGEIPPLVEPAPQVPHGGPTDDFTPDFGAPRRRRRKPKAETQPEAPQTPAPEAPPAVSPEDVENIAKAFGVGFRVIFDMVAAKRGEHWRLDERAETQLAGAWAVALAPWLVTSSKYLPLAIAAMATVGVVLPRLEADKLAAAAQAEGREVTPIKAPAPATP